MVIRTKHELRLAYELLKDPSVSEDHRRKLKMDIRNYHRRPDSNFKIMDDRGIDGYISLFPLPETITNLESADYYFMKNEYREVQPSMYDCTGQAFTVWYKVFQRQGKFWAYHCVSYDF